MELSRSLCCKELKKLDVIDSTGKEVGRIGDFTFTFGDGELKLKQFILIGPRWEEFLEAIGVRPDKDPVFDASMIDKISEKVHLNKDVEDLKTTLDECAISDEEILLSRLQKLDIYDKDGLKVGRAIDVDFDEEGNAWLTVGGGFIEEKLEAIGLKSDVDIIVPVNVIEAIGEIIKLSVSKKSLVLTLEEAVDDQREETVRARDRRDTTEHVAKVRLFNLRPF